MGPHILILLVGGLYNWAPTGMATAEYRSLAACQAAGVAARSAFISEETRHHRVNLVTFICTPKG